MSEPKKGALSLKNRTILVVDDQAFVRGIVKQVLRKFECGKVIEASDGFDAIRQIKGGSGQALGTSGDSGSIMDDVKGLTAQVDCVITDINMRPMNGLEFMKAIRSGNAGISRDVPVIVLTAHSDEMIISTVVALDADGFVTKPTSANALAEKLQRAFSRHREVKPIVAYASLLIPDLDMEKVFTDSQGIDQSAVQSITATDIAKLLGTSANSVPWSELKAGNVLAQNLCTINGVMVVPSGAKLTDTLIAALTDLSHIIPLQETVQIRS